MKVRTVHFNFGMQHFEEIYCQFRILDQIFAEF